MRNLCITVVRDLSIDQCDRCGGVWFSHDEWDDLIALREWEQFSELCQHPLTRGQWWFQFLCSVPLELNVRPRHRPWVTLGIAGLCTLIYSSSLVFDLHALALVPADRLRLERLPALWTYAFLHANVIHLLGNMYFLCVLGDNVEDVLGPWRYAMFYMAAALVSGGAYVAFHPSSNVPLMGASGAIAAVMAAYVILFRDARLTMMFLVVQRRLSAWAWMAFWIAFNVLGFGLDLAGRGAHVAYVAHLAGFAFGVAVIWPIRKRLIAQHPLLSLLASGRLQPDKASPHGASPVRERVAEVLDPR